MSSVFSVPGINPVFDLPDVQQFLKLLKVPEVQTVFNSMVENAIALSELNLLKRVAALEIKTGIEDPEDEVHPITLPEQLSLLAERVDSKTEPVKQEYVPEIEPRTTLEHKATEFALYVKDIVNTTGQMFLDSKQIMYFMKYELPEPLRMKDIQNPRQFKRDVLQRAKTMFPFIVLDKKKHGKRETVALYKPEKDYKRLNRMETYIRSHTT
jgi:hypothetical protein